MVHTKQYRGFDWCMSRPWSHQVACVDTEVVCQWVVVAQQGACRVSVAAVSVVGECVCDPVITLVSAVQSVTTHDTAASGSAGQHAPCKCPPAGTTGFDSSGA